MAGPRLGNLDTRVDRGASGRLRRAGAFFAAALFAFGLVVVAAPPAGAATVSTWTLHQPIPSPPARAHSSMAESPFTDSAVLFGGTYGGVYRDDTWTFDGTTKTWTERHPSVRPSARIDAAMAWDNEGKVVLFGGRDQAGQILGDTWEYDVTTNQWSLGSTGGPPAREQAAMAFDGGTVLLFGGADSNTFVLNDTWTYMSEYNSWTQRNPTTKPSIRTLASMSSSGFTGLAGSGHQGPVLFGGWTWGGYENDTWTWTGGNWVEQTPAASPPVREDAAMGFDPVHRHFVLYGGNGEGTGYLNDTWIYDGLTWTQASPIGNPPDLRFGGSLVTSNWTTGETVLFGLGSSDAWVYRTADPPSAPTALTALSGDGQAQLNWTAPASDGGRPILGYNVYVGTNPGGESTTPANGGTLVSGTSYTLTGLTNGTYYWVYVKAGNDAGLSPPSMETAARPRAPGATEGTWTPRSPAVVPPARVMASIAESPFTGDAVLFGGRNASENFNDTWTYDNATMTWTQWTSGQTPPARYSAAMAYDARYDVIVLFGGYNYWSGRLADTWVFDPHTHQWTEKSPAIHPSARESAVMSASSDGVILFGGYAGANLGDTWLYNSYNDTWTQQSPATSPPARQGASMVSAYNGLSGSAGYYGPVLFGGQTGPNANPTVVNDTWTYEWLGFDDGWSWVQQSSASGPAARSLAAMGYDPVKRQMVLFGGIVPATVTRLADTWTYDGDFWLPATPDRSPSARVGAVLAASDWPTGPLVLFGGNTGGSGFLSETWIFGPPPLPVALDDAYTINEDAVLSVPAPGVLGNDSDATGTLTVDSWTDPAHGTLATNANGSFTYTPPANWHGAVPFTYTARGPGGTATATVTVTVVSVADADTPVPDTYTTPQDTPLVVPAPGVLANDLDPDGDGTQVNVSLTTNPAHGTRSISADGTFTYTPASGWYGTDSFTYRLLSGASTATVTITVLDGVPPDTTITAGPPSATSAPSATFTFSGTDNVTPAAGLTFQCRLDGGDFAVCTSPVEYTGLAEGSHTFEVKATDAVGNQDSTPASQTWAVDTAPPDTTILSGPTQPTTPRTDAVFTFTGTDNVTAAGDLTFSCSLDTGAFEACTNPKTYTGLAYGPHFFEVKATDGAGNEDPTPAAYSWVAVDTGNAAPVAVDDTYTVAEDDVLTVAAAGVLANDTDADVLDTVSVLAFSGATAHGLVAVSADGSFVYTPQLNYAGTDTFTYSASDGIAEDQATVTVTVEAVNDPPVAANNAYTIWEDATLTLPAPGLLANDTDAEGDSLTAALVDGATHGALTLNADGSLTYKPDANFNGTDSFTYGAFDGASLSNVATVSITIDPDYDEPVAWDDAYTVAAGTVLTVPAPGVFINDEDIDGSGWWYADFTYSLPPAHGTLNASWTEDGGFTYTPHLGFQGIDTFGYIACDDNGSCSWDHPATVTITVTAANTAPEATDDSFSTDEDTALTVAAAAGVLANDTDAEGNPLSAALASGPSHAASFALNGDGSFTYAPAENFNGTDAFTYRASDGTASSAEVTVSLTVNPVVDGIKAENDAYTVDEDHTLSVAAGGVLANDGNPDGGTLTAFLLADPPPLAVPGGWFLETAHGALTLYADGSFAYLPGANFTGTDTFTYRAEVSPAYSPPATVTITVTPAPDAPAGVADTYSVDEDTTLIVDAAAGVLANDVDPDGDLLSPAATTAPAHGSLAMGPDGSFTYQPEADYFGSDTFTYQAMDAAGALSDVVTVTITVNPVFDAIKAEDDAYTVDEDQTLSVAAGGVLGNDSNPDGGTLTAFLLSGPDHGALTLNADGSFAYIPGANFTGTDTFTYRAEVSPAYSPPATVTITVTPANDPPVATGDSYATDEDQVLTVPAAGVLGNDSDADGDALTALLETNPANGTLTLNSDGSFVYTPTPGYFGADTFSYRASDGTLTSGVATVSITVTAVNDAPVAVADSYATDEDTALGVAAPGLLVNDSDPDGDALEIVVETPPAHGLLTPGAGGAFVYTPAADFNGTDGFTYRASDGSATSDPAKVTITVNAVNDVPVAAADTYSVDEDAALTVGAAGVLANDSHADADPPTAVLGTGPGHGALVLNPDGSFAYTPFADFNGADTFTYRAQDAEPAMSPDTTVTVTVNSVNDVPSAAADAYSVDEDAVLTIGAAGVLANDSHPDADPPTAVLVTGPANGALELRPDGSFTYQPYANFNGADDFTYEAADAEPALSAETTVTITVHSVNDVPAPLPDTYPVDEDTVLTVGAPGVLGNDSHPDTDPPTAVLGVGPAHGALVLNSDGSFSYDPDEGYNGGDSFTYRAADSTAQSDPVTVSITVVPVNDPPWVTPLTATASAQYSDAITAVELTGGDPDGDAVTFSATDLPAGVTLTDHGDGTATVSGTVTAPAGVYAATVTVSDGQATADAVATVTVTKENATVTNIGDLMFSAGTATSTNVTLRALVTEVPDGTEGDLALARVRFRLYRSANTNLSAPDRTGYTWADPLTGEAATVVPLPLDTWTVLTDIDPANGYWTSPPADPVAVTIYQPSAGKFATAGGWIADPPTSSPAVHANFGFSVRYGKSVRDPKGQAVYIYRVGNYDYIVKSNSWVGGGLAFSTNGATGAGGVTFSAKANVTVIDRTTGLVVPALSGGNFKIRVDATDGNPDTYAISIYRSTGQLYHQAGLSAAQVPLGGGNIVIHSR